MSQIEGREANFRLSGVQFPTQILDDMKTLLSLLTSDEPAGFWYIHGPNGVGKTYILIAAINEAIAQGRSGIYLSTTQMLSLLRETFSAKTVGLDEPQLLGQIKQATVLCIDELGRERDTDYSAEKLFEIFDHRYRAATQYDHNFPAKLTIFAGNYPLEELEPYLKSRLSDFQSKVIDLTGLPDRRENNNN
jgi:DNA replication protein DnaC